MKKFYAVSNGYQRGVYSTWAECYKQVHGYSSAHFKSFKTLKEAEMFLVENNENVCSDMTQGKGHYKICGNSYNESNMCDNKLDDTRSCSNELSSHPPPKSNIVDSCTDYQPSAKYRRVHECESIASRHMTTQHEGYLATAPHGSLIPIQYVYVDGACHRNGLQGSAQAGYGGYYGEGDCRNYALSLPLNEKHTNNRAELRAVIHALRQGVRDAGGSAVLLMANRVDYSTPVPLYRLRVHSDSKYVVEGLTKYSKKWVKNNFTLSNGKTSVQNQDLWKELIQLRDGYNTCFSQQHDVQPRRYCSGNTSNFGEGFEICHVRGHSNVFGNEMADHFAKMGVNKHSDETRET